ncbi:hypothetical protein T11_682 [Trichinella zimbabwensis]|uniref:Uncharacterized protein n=1 Tax=Trichinella zimbabwensis TaxID=268475 RepID=A0A0V1HG90_9BILA|nr:hypothetical protein T11_682 [Trichinella zimbabwensis]
MPVPTTSGCCEKPARNSDSQRVRNLVDSDVTANQLRVMVADSDYQARAKNYHGTPQERNKAEQPKPRNAWWLRPKTHQFPA